MATRALAWTALLLLLGAPLAVADDDSGEEKDDHEMKDRRDGRKLELKIEDDEATIKLKRENATTESSVKIEYDTDKAKLLVKHEEETAGNETEQKLEARFLALLEFVDADGDGAYDPGETIASAWALAEDAKDAKIPTNGTVRWGDIAVSEAASGNATGKKLSSRASFGENATFGLDLYVYGDLAMTGNDTLLPTEAKIDIVIQHYPYVRSDTALAVLVDLKAKEEFDDGRESDDEDGVASAASAGNLTFRLTFTWLENATVDGVDRDVRSTVLKSKEEAKPGEVEQKARVALAYPRGDLIVHDPTVGVQYGTASSGAREVPLPAALLVVGAVLLVAAVGRRRA